MPTVHPAVIATIFPNIGGWTGSLFVRKSLDGWYHKLKRPSWCPPDWAFGPVWTSLYSGMGYASYLVWRDGGGWDGPAKVPLILYGSQLTLNWIWTPIFFGAHNLPLSVVDIVLLWGNAAACGFSFYKINPVAGFIFVPYMAWLTLATCLNYRIYKDNPKIKEL